LHEAATQALSSITCTLSQQRMRAAEQLDSFQIYVSRHGQQLSSIELSGNQDLLWSSEDDSVVVQMLLPVSTRLESLSINSMQVQLHPGSTAPAQLTKLHLQRCMLKKGLADPETILSQLPAVQHLHMNLAGRNRTEAVSLSGDMLLLMPQLTYLMLGDMTATSPAAVQDLQHLRHLRHLSMLCNRSPCPAYVLQPLSHLTHLHLQWCYELARSNFAPAGLTNKSQLRHLDLDGGCLRNPDAAAALLSQLQQLTQLTFLRLSSTLTSSLAPSAAAYSALTASAGIRTLDLSGCALPGGIWKFLFPVGKVLPQLQEVRLAHLQQPLRLTVSDAASIAGCCPGLRKLDVGATSCKVEDRDRVVARLSYVENVRLPREI
jgi:hypothetical protein